MAINREDLVAKLLDNYPRAQRFLVTANLNYWNAFNSCKVLVTIPVIENFCVEYLEEHPTEIAKLINSEFKDWPSFQITKDLYTQTLSILIKLCLEHKQLEILARELFVIMGIRTHFSRIKKHFKYCDENAFQLAMEHLPKQHLFNQKENIQNAFYWLIDELFNRYKKQIPKTNSSRPLWRMIYDWRTRWAQSLRSLANKFYQIKEGKIKIVSMQNREFLIDTKVEQAVENTINTFLMYKDFDEKLLKTICSKVVIKTTYITPFIDQLFNVDENQLRVILYIIINNKNFDEFRSNDTVKELMSRMSTRFTKKRESLKERMDDFVLELGKLEIESGKLYAKVSNPYKQKIRVALMLFLYYTLVKSVR